jgi:ABC-type sulfate/molybdate transport systems ATPase subunit
MAGDDRGLRIQARLGLRDFGLEMDLSAGPGERVAVFGPSCSGKTTLLRTVAGLTRPDGGSVDIGGRTVFDAGRGVDVPPEDRRCGYVPQGLSLFPHLDAAANVAFGLRQGARRERREQAIALLESFGLSHLAGESPARLSGGEAQRVAIARAVALQPDVFLLDEPLASLDRKTGSEVMETLAVALDMASVPALLVTHSAEEASRLCQSAVRVQGGRITDQEKHPTEEFQWNQMSGSSSSH